MYILYYELLYIKLLYNFIIIYYITIDRTVSMLSLPRRSRLGKLTSLSMDLTMTVSTLDKFYTQSSVYKYHY